MAIAALLLGCALLGAGSVSASPWFDLKTTNPWMLLEYLKMGGVTVQSVVIIDEPVEGWVKQEYLPQLVSLLDSEWPCAPVMLSRSSYLPGPSTVGEQAAFMIQGFRAGRYPPDLHSDRMGPAIKDEIRAWWQARGQ